MIIGTKYEGLENLSIMTLASNYNDTIYTWLSQDTNRDEYILDFGSGIGEFCNRFIDAGYQNTYSVEIDDSMHSSHKCETSNSLDSYRVKFDYIYSCNVLEHIEDDLKILLELYIKMQPGGKIKIFVPAFQILFSDMDREVGHFRRYAKKELIDLMTQAGFAVDDCRYFDFAGFFATISYKILNKKGSINPKAIIFYDKFFFPISRLIDKLTRGSVVGKNLILTGKKL